MKHLSNEDIYEIVSNMVFSEKLNISYLIEEGFYKGMIYYRDLMIKQESEVSHE